MHVLPDKPTVYFDVDDTLVLWRGAAAYDPARVINVDGMILTPHAVHIERLVSHGKIGHNVVVWSAGGSDWAAKVIRALDLEAYVSVVLPKPHWAYDDTPYSDFLPTRRWLMPVAQQEDAPCTDSKSLEMLRTSMMLQGLPLT